MKTDAHRRKRFSLIPAAEQGLGHVQIEEVDLFTALLVQGQGKIDGDLALAASGFPQKNEVFRLFPQPEGAQAAAFFHRHPSRIPCSFPSLREVLQDIRYCKRSFP